MDKMKTATNDFGSMFKKLEVILEEYLVKRPLNSRKVGRRLW